MRDAAERAEPETADQLVRCDWVAVCHLISSLACAEAEAQFSLGLLTSILSAYTSYRRH